MPNVAWPGTGRRPMDLLLGGYALVAGTALLFPHRPAGWWALLLVHGLVAAACFGVRPVSTALGRVAGRFPRAAGILAGWYPLLLLPVLYRELAPLNRAVHGGRFFDSNILGWEQALFGLQPSRAWAEAVPHLWLSEPLHAAYLSYYFLLYVPALFIWLRRPRRDFHQAVFTVMLVFVAHYLFFIWFPVQGPRYLFPPHAGGIEGGLFYRIAHGVLEVGSSQGAAFPSSHVGASAAVAIVGVRYLPRAAPLLVLLTAGVALGAVYGGFHYAIDAIAGLLLGVLAALLAPAAYARLARWRGGSVAEPS